MKKESALEIARRLAEKTHKLNSGGQPLAWSGAGNFESQLHELRKSAAELVQAIGAGKPYQEIMHKHEALAGQIDAAGLTGLIGESEIAEYYALVDEVWAAIEHGKNTD